MVVILALLAAKPARCQGSASSSEPSKAGNDATDENLSRTLNSIRVQSTLVVVPVSVASPSGEFVDDLRQTDFRVLDDGVPQKITRFGQATEPVAAVVVIQANDSVEPLIDQVHPLGPLLSNLLLGSNGKVAVITYADQVRVVQGFSSDQATLAKTLSQIKANGNKARLNDALGSAVVMLARRTRADRRVIIVVSDGFDLGSATNRAQVLRAATGANVAIYGLRYGKVESTLKHYENSEPSLPPPSGVPPPASTPSAASATDGMNLTPLVGIPFGVAKSEVHRNLLHWYAGYTGGVSYTSSKKDDLQYQLQQIALEINNQYVLAYVPSTLKTAGFHRIRVTVSKPRLRVRARAGYFYGVPE
jgi:VWFA-related protein